MPQVVAWAAAAIASAVGLTAGTAAFGVATAVVEAAIYAGVTYALAPKVKSGGGAGTAWSADPEAGIPFVVGRRGVSGQIVYRETGPKPVNALQGIVSVYSGAGPVNAFGQFYADSVPYTFNGTGALTNPPERSGRIFMVYKYGAQPDTALVQPRAGWTPTTWTSAHKLSGKACSWMTLVQNEEHTQWPAGEPKPIQVIEGILAWDPRLDSTWPGGAGACRLATPATWVYSTNPLIHALKWCLGYFENSKQVGGIGIPVGNIDVTAFLDAANIADANGWTISAVPYSDDDKYQVFQAMLQAGGCLPSRNAGKISCVSRGAAKTSLVTISTDDTAGPFEIDLIAPREGRINTVIPRCIQENQDWEMASLGSITRSTYVTEDGSSTRSRGIDYPYVSSANQAAQLAAYDIADSREGVTGTVVLKPYMRDLKPGDAFTITEAGFALSGQKCIVRRRAYDPASDTVRITFRGETDAKHAWALAITGTPPPAPSIGGENPYAVTAPTVTDWSLATGTGVGSLLVSRITSTELGMTGLSVEYRINGGTVWTLWNTFTGLPTLVELTGLDPALSYQVAISYLNEIGAKSARYVMGPTATSNVVIPASDVIYGDRTVAANLADLVVGVGVGSLTVTGTSTTHVAFSGDDPATANFQITASEDVILNDPTISVAGTALINAGGFTDAARTQLLSGQQSGLTVTSTLSQLVNHAASTAAITSYLQSNLGQDSTVSVDLALDLTNASSASLSDFPASLTVTMYVQESTDGVTWGAWGALASGAKTLTRITAGTPTSSQYLVQSRTIWAPTDPETGVGGTYTYYAVTSPASLTIAIAAVTKTAKWYRYGIVGPTTPFGVPGSIITLNDTDTSPSFIVSSNATSSVPYINASRYRSDVKIRRGGSGGSTTSIDIVATDIVVSTPAGLQRTISGLSVTVDMTTTGLNALDTGTIAANSKYHVWVISNGSTSGAIVSLSETAPTMPSGYSHKMWIGSLLTNAAAEIRPYQQDNDQVHLHPDGAGLTLISGSSGSVSTPTFTAADVAAYVPTKASVLHLKITNMGGVVCVGPTSSMGSFNAGASGPPIVFSATNHTGLGSIPRVSDNIYYACDDADGRVQLVGWTLRL